MAGSDVAADQPQSISFTREAGGILLIHLAGVWRLRRGVAAEAAELERELRNGHSPTRVSFEAAALGAWDSALVIVLARIEGICTARQIAVDRDGLPSGVRRLLELASGVGRQPPETAEETRFGLLERVGAATIDSARTFSATLTFLGDVTIAFGRFFTGRARYRRVDLATLIQASGADALTIVALISYLVGIILAFMGAVQLEQFGASIYVADLVAIGITREMGAMMTAIIMAGRTGAAFAAQLGTMKVRQEVEALQTMGISPIEFLVVPRIVALVLMMPLLTLYADFIGVLGGATIGVAMLHISFTMFLKEGAKAVWPSGAVGGLFKALVYGILIAVAGCYQGMKCGNSASAVGEATTAAVVNGIILIVVACGLFALIFHVIGI